MKKAKGLIILAAAVAVIVLVVVIKNLTAEKNYSKKYAGYDLTADVQGLGRDDSYVKYLEKYENAPIAQTAFSINAADFAEAEDAYIMDECGGLTNVLYTGDSSEVSWKVNIPETGMYNIFVKYYTVPSRGVEVERAVYINGEIPFHGADDLSFSRIWTNNGAVRTDNRGNQIRPSQTERFEWQGQYLKDYMGYIVHPYKFYLEAGENTITFKAVNEPVILSNIDFCVITEGTGYEQYAAEHASERTSAEAANAVIKINGEDAAARSDASLYAKYDKAAANTDPYSITATILNYIGGDPWKVPGQWIEWDFNAPADGWYNITIKGRQYYERGAVSGRSLYIDGEIPFKEVETVEFKYSNEWETLTLADANGTPYKFYLTAGDHKIRLEANLGELGDILNTLSDNVFRLNQMYRKILVLTGANPDKYRDYNLDQVYPEVIEAMALESKRLYKVIDDCVEITGQKSDKIATALTLAIQLERFDEDPDEIPKALASFKENIAGLGTSILSMSEIKLDVDYIVVQGTEADKVKDSVGFFRNAWHSISSFFATFFVDYNAIGDVYDEDDEEVIEVWLLSGRDQNEVMKMMVDDTFTPNSHIKVNVQLIDAGALLSAVMAGNGPDVVLTVDAQQPVNYALRHAVEDLTQFPDFYDVVADYPESSYTSYKFEGGVYGLPETQNYNVMFYRKDIMEELGLEVPQTWDDLVNMLATIQGANMSVALPTVERRINNAQNPDLSLYFTLVQQMGGTFYDEPGQRIIIDSEAGVGAFELYTSIFNDYGLPRDYDFVSRFRSGEIPLGITDYNTYNTLVVSAPEIRGLWDFTLIPGTERTDANGNTYIDRSVHCWGTCSMMLANDDEAKKKKAWEFMKWWASADTQVRFGRELEAVMGSAARYATANLEAFKQLSWSAEQVKVLEEQRSFTKGFREVAGGYYTSRHLTNACRKVMNNKEDPREVLLDYVRTINEEITKKRKEYGLSVRE